MKLQALIINGLIFKAKEELKHWICDLHTSFAVRIRIPSFFVQHQGAFGRKHRNHLWYFAVLLVVMSRVIAKNVYPQGIYPMHATGSQIGAYGNRCSPVGSLG